MRNTLCLSCRKDVVPEIESRIETFPVRGENIEVESQVAICPLCREDLSVEELDELTLKTAFGEYRLRHGLLSPDEITEVRKKYGLSQRAFSLVLGWGEITAHRYEAGSVQDAAHDAQLRMAADPHNMALLLSANGHRLTGRQKLQLERALSGEQAGVAAGPGECSWPSIARRSVDEFSGFRAFDIDIFTEMVVYFASAPRMFRTKLNKLLFYSDFLNFKQSAVSISGAQYLAFERGPVPQHYDWITETLEQQGDIRTLEWTYGEKSGDVFKSTRAADTSIFTDSEFRVLAFVRDRFANATSKHLIDLSHAEAAYSKTASKKMISYHWAHELSVSIAD